MKSRLAAAFLALVLAGCSTGSATNPAPDERAQAVAHLESLGLRNIAALHINGPISEGQATYEAQRVRFLYDADDDTLRTWEFEPPVP